MRETASQVELRPNCLSLIGVYVFGSGHKIASSHGWTNVTASKYKRMKPAKRRIWIAAEFGKRIGITAMKIFCTIKYKPQ